MTLNKRSSKIIFIVIITCCIITAPFIFQLILTYLTSANAGNVDDGEDDGVIIPYRHLYCEPIFINGTATSVNAQNWSWAKEQEWCVYHEGIYYFENLMINGKNSSSCIEIHNSNVVFRIKNCTVYNSTVEEMGSHGVKVFNAGIKLENTNNSIIIENNCSLNNGIGILLSRYSSYNSIVNNSIEHSGSSIGGILIWGDNGTCKYNNITNNKINNGMGIILSLSHYNTISGNIVINTRGYGIGLQGCDYNIIMNNNASSNGFDGIMIYVGNFNNVSGNIVFNNTNSGIDLLGSNFTNIDNNTARFNMNSGIAIRGGGIFECYNNTITDNLLNINNINGILLSEDVNFTIITRNQITNNNDTGLLIKNTCENTLIFNNAFLNNKLHAQDSGNNNHWNNTQIGNYWDNYSGLDVAPLDGIGDIPYIINVSPLIQDFLPLYLNPF